MDRESHLSKPAAPLTMIPSFRIHGLQNITNPKPESPFIRASCEKTAEAQRARPFIPLFSAHS
jgi:hypothetical protein